jgi:hypothetical protein
MIVRFIVLAWIVAILEGKLGSCSCGTGMPYQTACGVFLIKIVKCQWTATTRLQRHWSTDTWTDTQLSCFRSVLWIWWSQDTAPLFVWPFLAAQVMWVPFFSTLVRAVDRVFRAVHKVNRNMSGAKIRGWNQSYRFQSKLKQDYSWCSILELLVTLGTAITQRENSTARPCPIV